jgi:multicomponent Na+:H+ antiporter subunit B
MRSVILCTAVRFITPLLLLFAVFLFYRGHNEPGGGFIAGLVAASAFSLMVIADGVKSARRAMRADPRGMLAVGLALAVGSGFFAVGSGPFMTGTWIEIPTPLGTGKLGTPLLFDLGVFFIVLGATMTMVFSIREGAEE